MQLPFKIWTSLNLTQVNIELNLLNLLMEDKKKDDGGDKQKKVATSADWGQKLVYHIYTLCMSIYCRETKREREKESIVFHSCLNPMKFFLLQRHQHMAWLWLSEPMWSRDSRKGGWGWARQLCVLCTCVFVCVRVCTPVVFVSEVVYNGRPDAGHAPLAVVPSSCDDWEPRSTEPLLASYTEHKGRPKSRTHTQENSERQCNNVAATLSSKPTLHPQNRTGAVISYCSLLRRHSGVHSIPTCSV